MHPHVKETPHLKTRILQGDRIGRLGTIRVGSAAVIFDAQRKKILLTQRSDNGQWCLPGGALDPGESATENCIREVLEETGLHVTVKRLIGIYTSPHYMIQYPDGRKVQIVAFCFECEITGGVLGLSDETTAFGYYSEEEIASLELILTHHQRIKDAFAFQEAPYIR
jgi:8-oxo-dGTP pyrophosphatase MutT (NUDIX family)